MSDSDYIKAGERWFNPAGVLVAHDAILASHAVADAVMRELAEALREHKCPGPAPNHHCSCTKALAKYDRLTGGTDDA